MDPGSGQRADGAGSDRYRKGTNTLSFDAPEAGNRHAGCAGEAVPNQRAERAGP